MKKAGKPDPYAYVPLQHQFLNKRYTWHYKDAIMQVNINDYLTANILLAT